MQGVVSLMLVITADFDLLGFCRPADVGGFPAAGHFHVAIDDEVLCIVSGAGCLRIEEQQCRRAACGEWGRE